MKLLKYSGLSTPHQQRAERFRAKIPVGRLSAVLALGLLPMTAHAEDFNGTTFLQWTQAQQDSYIQTSVTMAGFIASQNAGNGAECLNNWYFKDNALRNKRNASLRSNIEKFPSYHPAITILATIEKNCGSFTFSD